MPDRIDEHEVARFLWDVAEIGFAILDKNGIIRKANPHICAMLGYAQNELEGMHFADVTFSDDKEGDAREYAKLMDGRIKHYEMRKRWRTKFGKPVPGHLHVCWWVDGLLVFGQAKEEDPLHILAPSEDRRTSAEMLVAESLRNKWVAISIIAVIAAASKNILDWIAALVPILTGGK